MRPSPTLPHPVNSHQLHPSMTNGIADDVTDFKHEEHRYREYQLQWLLENDVTLYDLLEGIAAHLCHDIQTDKDHEATPDSTLTLLKDALASFECEQRAKGDFYHSFPTWVKLQEGHNSNVERPTLPILSNQQQPQQDDPQLHPSKADDDAFLDAIIEQGGIVQ